MFEIGDLSFFAHKTQKLGDNFIFSHSSCIGRDFPFLLDLPLETLICSSRQEKGPFVGFGFEDEKVKIIIFNFLSDSSSSLYPTRNLLHNF